MRFYSVVRFGTYKIRYAEVASTRFGMYTVHHGNAPSPSKETLTVPSPVPKEFDPFLLWKQTDRREPFRILEIQDKTGHTWFEIKSVMPLSNILEIPSDALKDMR